MRKIFIILFILLILVGCNREETEEERYVNISKNSEIKEDGKMVYITFKTEDNVKIYGYYIEGGDKGVILLHQLNLDSSSYTNLARKLNDAGFSVIAIDFRGHGKSDGNWRNFSEEDFRNMLGDAASAALFLLNKGKTPYAVVGSSIGANTALRLASEKVVEKAVLLSPGMNYRGIDITDVKTDIPVLVVTSEKDTYSLESSKTIVEKNLIGEKELLIIPGKSHGTFMLIEDAQLEEKIKNWIIK